MANKISQREARRLRKRVEQLEHILERERNSYATDFPGGVHLGSVNWEAVTAESAAVYTARRLGHAVVAVADGTKRFNLYALPHPKVPV